MVEACGIAETPSESLPGKASGKAWLISCLGSIFSKGFLLSSCPIDVLSNEMMLCRTK